MKNYPFAEAILAQTNGGLTIIEDYYPELKGLSTNQKFKRRKEEKTASCSLKETKEGTWLVCDWGEWEKPKNAIGVCMVEDNLTFGEACKKLAKLYNIEYQGVNHTAKPKIDKRPKRPEEKENTYSFEYKDELSKNELAVIGPRVTNDIAKRFKLKAVKSYQFVTKNEVILTTSTDDYPILVYDFGDWQKIYQPKSADKSYRFRYAGGRPKDYVFGLEDAVILKTKIEKEVMKNAEDEEKIKDKDLKIDDLILCSGDRDALNVASLGYAVIWLNSETANLSPELYKKICGLANNIYNLPDIDSTGVKQAIKLGLQYLDLKTIWLPSYLKDVKDWRGNYCSDFSDFIKLKYDPKKPQNFIKSFKKSISNALPMRFWEEEKTEKGTKYHYNIVYAEHFLRCQGFYRMETPYEKDEYCYVHLENNVIRKTTPNKIEFFVNKFLEDRQLPIRLRNMVKKTTYLKDSMLCKLPIIEPNLKDHDAKTQYWFFKRNTLKITADGVEVFKNAAVDKMVMEDKVIDHPKTISEAKFVKSFEEKHFNIVYDKSGNLDIQILKKNNHFLNFLINTSRIHWRKELEDSYKPNQEKEAAQYFKKNKFNIAGSNLNEDEILEQKLHLINKIYAIGYMFHKYKNKSKPWFVFGIDNKQADIGESHGGSGKSLIIDYLKIILKNQFPIPGRSKKAIESEFLFDGVDYNTGYIFIDDMGMYFPFNQFFSDITGSMRVRPLHSKAHNIEYKDSPKMAGTSNYPPQNLDPSTLRRILFMVNSDYYHSNRDNEYKQDRPVSADFDGRNLFDDFTEEELNDVIVFWSQCLQFFLKHDKKIDPPMGMVRKRSLMAEMGDVLRNWAEVYFNHETGRLDTIVSRSEAWDDYRKVSGGKKSANGFKKGIKAFCEFKGYVFNPKELLSKDGRIIKRIGGGEPQECFYIKTEKNLPITPIPKVDKGTNNNSDLPF